MPIPSHLSLTGNTQGKIEGSCEIVGREGTILVYAMDHLIQIPRDPRTGLPTGQRVHDPLTVTKEFDKSSPPLYQALCSGEQFSEVKFEFYRISPEGTQELYFTITLENAIIVNIKAWYPPTMLASSEPYRHMEDVSFTYAKIIWTWEPDGIETEDNVREPK